MKTFTLPAFLSLVLLTWSFGSGSGYVRRGIYTYMHGHGCVPSCLNIIYDKGREGKGKAVFLIQTPDIRNQTSDFSLHSIHPNPGPEIEYNTTHMLISHEATPQPSTLNPQPSTLNPKISLQGVRYIPIPSHPIPTQSPKSNQTKPNQTTTNE
jgi:hypothetical protein